MGMPPRYTDLRLGMGNVSPAAYTDQSTLCFRSLGLSLLGVDLIDDIEDETPFIEIYR